MKAFNLFVALLFAMSLCLAATPVDSHAKSENKETTSSAVKKTKDKTSKKKDVTGAKAKKQKADKNKTVTKLKSKSVSINSADKKLLRQLPGVGDKTAAAIVKYRKENGKFKSVDDLMKVKGIGDKKLKKMKQYLKL